MSSLLRRKPMLGASEGESASAVFRPQAQHEPDDPRDHRATTTPLVHAQRALGLRANWRTGAVAYSAAFMGHMTTIVRRNTRKIIAAEPDNHNRYGKRVRHPLTSAPIAAMRIIGVTRTKNCPGSTGKRGPYGRRTSDAGGAALQAPARTRKSNSFAPTPMPHSSTATQRNGR